MDYNGMPDLENPFEEPEKRVFYSVPIDTVFDLYFAQKLLAIKCNALEASILYRENPAKVEALLKTGRFDINDCFHIRYTGWESGKETGVREGWTGKTLLDIVREMQYAHDYQTDNPRECRIRQANIGCSYQKIHYQEIEQLLIAYGGKTAIEIAAIHPFNDYFFEDIQRRILYTPDFFEQQTLRLVCSRWKKIIDNNPLIKNLQSYFILLRNPKPHRNLLANMARVMLGAQYNREDYITGIIIDSQRLKKEKSVDHSLSFVKKTEYCFSFLLDAYKHAKYNFEGELSKYNFCFPEPVSYGESLLDIKKLIGASFLEKADRLQDLLNVSREELDNPQHAKSLQAACIINADFHNIPAMTVLINALKNTLFLDKFFDDLILISYVFKSLKVLELLLSSGLDINRITEKNMTIKDRILDLNKNETDSKYIIEVNALLDKYDAKTYHELSTSRTFNKKIITGGIGIGIAMMAFYLLCFNKLSSK